MALPDKAPIIAAVQAGARTVAVGDYGCVVLSDDGQRFRQAKRVPTRTVLTSVYFINEQKGWAVGHDGTILGTEDGGENWSMQRETPGKDQVLLSVWFETPERGLAVGQFGFALETLDGGKSWSERRLIESEMGERHLLHLFPGEGSMLFAAVEAGGILRSEDGGRHWQGIQTDNKGSFWTGRRLKDGTLIAAGMRGHVFRSTDQGKSWQESPWISQQSITAALQNDSGDLVLMGNSGIILRSSDAGKSLQQEALVSRANVTAAVLAGGRTLVFSLGGVVPAK